MPNDAAPRLLDVVEGLLGELKDASAWIEEVRADLAASETRRIRLAQAMDHAIATLEPPLRRHYEEAIRGLLGDPGPNRGGRPPVDARHETVMSVLGGWPHETISTTELTLELERQGFRFGTSYVPGMMRRLEGRGIVLRTARGRYRVTRLHPHLVARRTGLLQRLRETGHAPAPAGGPPGSPSDGTGPRARPL